MTLQKILYNVWRSTSDLWDLVIQKRIELQQLRLKLKLHLVLNEQVSFESKFLLFFMNMQKVSNTGGFRIISVGSVNSSS